MSDCLFPAMKIVVLILLLWCTLLTLASPIGTDALSIQPLKIDLRRLNDFLRVQVKNEFNSTGNYEVLKSLVKLHQEIEKISSDSQLLEGDSNNMMKWKTMRAISNKALKETCQILNITDPEACAMKIKVLQILFGIKTALKSHY